MKMVTVQQPGSLESLALDSLVTYIREMSAHATVDICRRLKLYLSESIPPTLADEVTAKLLSCLNRKIKKECQCQELIEAVILPAVTTLDLYPYHSHSDKLYKDDWNRSDIIQIVLNKLDKLPNLKILHIKGGCETIFYPSSSLVEFTCKDCNFETLKSLSECCKLLRKLHVPDSEFYDHDFIELILTFKHLEDLNLRDILTTLREPLPLVETLTRRMPVARVRQLKKFGCTIDSVREFEYLMHQVLELQLIIEILCQHVSDLFPGCKFLANLKHLKSLYLVCLTLHVDPVLDVIGSQLTHLNLRILGPYDVCKVVEKCTSVQCLHLRSASSTMPVPSAENMRRLPPLKYLKCLSLKFYYKPHITACFMLICKNVEVLSINSEENDEIIVSTFLNEGPMMALKQLTWESHYIKREKMLKIVEHCPNIEILRGSYVWNRQGNEARKERNYLLS